MKGIILAGGKATRLYPASLGFTKSLLPIYDKPMIYYPLTNLIQAGIKDVLIITTKQDVAIFKRLLGCGERFGINISYAVEEKPLGIGATFFVAEDFIGNDSVCLILSDNIFYGDSLPKMLQKSAELKSGCELYALPVPDPEKFGVAYTKGNKLIKIVEKPTEPESNLAVTGLYFYDNDVVKFAKTLKPSARGEYEITDINNEYLKRGKCKLNILKNDVAWLDSGNCESLFSASEFVKAIQTNTGKMIACVEEECYKRGYIDKKALAKNAEMQSKTPYGKHLKDLCK